VLAETLVVLTFGLILNRVDGFYPSWQALRGDTGTASVTAPPPRGRLDADFTGTVSSLAWRPADLPSWRLAATPTVVVPHGYRDQPSTTYPVVLVLAGTPADATAAVRAAQHADGVVTVVARPTAATPAAALGRIGADLPQDVRATAYGWGLVATTRGVTLADSLVDGSPQLYAGEALIGPAMPAAARPNGPVPVALVRPALKGRAKPPGPGITLAGPSGALWTIAARWAAQQTSRPLQPAVELPQAAAR
jgi:lysyl-tRNA synthetase class 2